jgi:hypothetical protein
MKNQQSPGLDHRFAVAAAQLQSYGVRDASTDLRAPGSPSLG